MESWDPFVFNSALQMPVWYHVPSQQLSPGVGHCPVCVEVSPWNTPVQGGQHFKGVQTQKCVCPYRNNSTTVTLMACCMPDRSHHCHHCCVSEEHWAPLQFGQRVLWVVTGIYFSLRGQGTSPKHRIYIKYNWKCLAQETLSVSFIKGSSVRPSCEISNLGWCGAKVLTYSSRKLLPISILLLDYSCNG